MVKAGQKFAFGMNVYTVTDIFNNIVRCAVKNVKGEELIIFGMEVEHFEHLCETGIIKLF